jgi:hypothetical protein
MFITQRHKQAIFEKDLRDPFGRGLHEMHRLC